MNVWRADRKLSPQKVATTAIVMLIALLLALFAGMTAASGDTPLDKTLPADPTEGMTDQQKDATYTSDEASFFSQYATWVQQQPVSDPAWLLGLTHSSQTASYDAPQASLSDAVNAASIVLEGVATAYQGLPDATSQSTLQATWGASLGGCNQVQCRGIRLPGAFTIAEPGGLRPTSGWTGAFIADAENAPVLLPGHTYILLLQYDAPDNTYSIQSFTGWYSVAPDDTVMALAGNPFGQDIDGLPTSAFLAQIEALAPPQ